MEIFIRKIVIVPKSMTYVADDIDRDNNLKYLQLKFCFGPFLVLRSIISNTFEIYAVMSIIIQTNCNSWCYPLFGKQ